MPSPPPDTTPTDPDAPPGIDAFVSDDGAIKPGWYSYPPTIEDPEFPVLSSNLRYWNGSMWEGPSLPKDETTEVVKAVEEAAPGLEKRFSGIGFLAWALMSLGLLVALLIVLILLLGGGDEEAPAAAGPSEGTATTASQAQEPGGSASTPTTAVGAGTQTGDPAESPCLAGTFTGAVTGASIENFGTISADGAMPLHFVRGVIDDQCAVGITIRWVGMMSSEGETTANNPNGETCHAFFGEASGILDEDSGAVTGGMAHGSVGGFEPWIGADNGPATCAEIVDLDQVGRYLSPRGESPFTGGVDGDRFWATDIISDPGGGPGTITMQLEGKIVSP